MTWIDNGTDELRGVTIYDVPPPLLISLTTDGAISFGSMGADEELDTYNDISDLETVNVVSGPVDLLIETDGFTDGTTTWTYGLSNGAVQAIWQYSTTGSLWSNF